VFSPPNVRGGQVQGRALRNASQHALSRRPHRWARRSPRAGLTAAPPSWAPVQQAFGMATGTMSWQSERGRGTTEHCVTSAERRGRDVPKSPSENFGSPIETNQTTSTQPRFSRPLHNAGPSRRFRERLRDGSGVRAARPAVAARRTGLAITPHGRPHRDGTDHRHDQASALALGSASRTQTLLGRASQANRFSRCAQRTWRSAARPRTAQRSLRAPAPAGVPAPMVAPSSPNIKTPPARPCQLQRLYSRPSVLSVRHPVEVPQRCRCTRERQA